MWNLECLSLKGRNKHRKGFTLVASAVCAVMVFGMAGLSIDVGRMYITKNEAQSYADSAALYAALQLDGSAQGVSNAESAVSSSTLRWNFATNSFTGTVVEYSADGSTNWKKAADLESSQKKNMRYVRVTPTVSTLALFFLPVTGTGFTATVKARAIGGQVVKNSFAAGTNGIFPFSPVAHAYGTSSTAVYNADSTHNFGFAVGGQYTLRWPSNPNTVNFNNVCSGDSTVGWVTKADGQGNEQRGYIQYTDASSIAAAIQGDHLDYTVALDTLLNVSVDPTNGAKAAEQNALGVRIAQDGDTTSTDYASYIANPNHNGRRLVSVVVQSGYRDESGTLLPTNQQAVGVGYAQFLLLPISQYEQSGNKPWCAIYVGNSPLENSDNTGGVGNEGLGVSYVRLSQ